MSALNYAKWKTIEVSDDEDDTHPNIDTPSLFRWRHTARVERMEEAEKTKKEHEQKRKELDQRRKNLNEKVKKASQDGGNVVAYEKEQEELDRDEKKWQDEEAELHKKERLTPWNVDTIGQVTASKTLINKDKPSKKPANMTEEEQAQYYKEFVEKHKKDIKAYGMFKHYDDSQRFLEEHLDLVCEETANYLVVWCIDLEMEEKHPLMEHVSHQTMIMQFILELAKSLQYDPRQCVKPFFQRMKTADKQYKDAFFDELNAFKDRIKKRAAQKVEEALAQYEEEERQKRLGPGGLDPVEVMDTLPAEMQECFKSRDITMLQDVISKLPRDQAAYHLDRCVKSGLWVPGGNQDETDASNEEKDGQQEYETVNKD